MKYWNKTAYVKTGVIIILSLLNLVSPIDSTIEVSYLTVVASFLMIAFVVFLVHHFKLGLFFGNVMGKPSWNDSPIQFVKPLVFWQFIAMMFIGIGLAMVLNGFIYFGELKLIGIQSFAYGAGVYVGIWLIFRLKNKNTD